MKWWNSYKTHVKNKMPTMTGPAALGVPYWRNRLFTNVVLYLLPVSLVALVPGVIMSVVGGIPMLAFFDLLAVGLVAVVVLHPRIPFLWRKLLVVGCLYFISVVLLLYLGSLGPGLLYLLALTIFIALIFPVEVAYWSVATNVLICIGMALVIQFQLFDSALNQVYSVGAWLAVSANLIFLSVVILAGLQLLFRGLQASLDQADELQQQLRQESKTLARMLQQMEVKNQELEQFAYVASHDLQEPLQTISGLVDMVEKQFATQLGPDGTNYMAFMRQLSDRMSALITGLLTYSRIGKERQLETVSCAELVGEVMADMQATIQASKATIQVGDLPTLAVYPLEFKLLIQNLVSNAIKFRREKELPVIQITARETDDYVCFAVADNGIGFDPRYKEKVFVIFQRLHARSKYEGTGIGLAHCKKIVELHGGKIEVDTQVGQGSVFTFTILKSHGPP